MATEIVTLHWTTTREAVTSNGGRRITTDYHEASFDLNDDLDRAILDKMTADFAAKGTDFTVA